MQNAFSSFISLFRYVAVRTWLFQSISEVVPGTLLVKETLRFRAVTSRLKSNYHCHSRDHFSKNVSLNPIMHKSVATLAINAFRSRPLSLRPPCWCKQSPKLLCQFRIRNLNSTTFVCDLSYHPRLSSVQCSGSVMVPHLCITKQLRQSRWTDYEKELCVSLQGTHKSVLQLKCVLSEEEQSVQASSCHLGLPSVTHTHSRTQARTCTHRRAYMPKYFRTYIEEDEEKHVRTHRHIWKLVGTVGNFLHQV